VQDLLARFFDNLIGRIHGPMTFRLLLQPTAAIIFAVRDGLKDARQGRPAYLWAITLHGAARRDLLREGSRAVARVLLLGAVMDLIYQLIEFRRVYPGELIAVALLLAFVPYLLLRGPVNRLAGWWLSRPASSSSSRPRLRLPGP